MARSLFESVVAVSAVLALACACAEVPADAAPAKAPARTEPQKAPEVANPCNAHYAAGFALKAASTSESPKRSATPPKPAKGVAIIDPDSGTCFVRATAHDDEPPTGFARNDYSRREAFNADETKFLVSARDGFWHLYDARTLRWLKQFKGPAGDAEPQWDHADPNIFYYVPNNGGTELNRMHIDSGETDLAIDLAPLLPKWAAKAEHIWTRSEGAPSLDDRYWGFQIEDHDFKILGFMVLDLTTKKLVGSRQETSIRPDNVTMSPSGRWFIVSGTTTDPTWAWSPDFTKKKKLHHRVEHADVATTANGHDVYVSIDYEASGGPLFYTDLDACEAVDADARDAPICPRTRLFNVYERRYASALHISGNAHRTPGWIAVSTYALVTPNVDPPPPRPWYTDAIFAVELAPSPRIFALGAHHSNVSRCYPAEPQASVGRDFTKILFNSNWGASENCRPDDPKEPAELHDIDAYLMTLPAHALPEAR
ncbi:MAG TPA: hypothetical protein VFL30_07000 [Rhodanobacteraceae bacterium]|nr:hypothetical protein [Rhodanobacteraceae bacterium]